MSDKLPLFPKATSMLVHSGNIINWNRLKRKPNLSPTDELCDCLSKSLDDYLKDADKTQLQYVTELSKLSTEDLEKMDDTERQEVKITVKVFVCLPQSPSAVSEAVNKVLNELGTSYVETVLLSVSPVIAEDDTEQPLSTVSEREVLTNKSKALIASFKKDAALTREGSQRQSTDRTLEASRRPSVDDHQRINLSTLNEATKATYELDASKSKKVTFKSTEQPLYFQKRFHCNIKDGLKYGTVTLDDIKPYWSVMEDLVTQDKVLSLGVCDLNKESLEDLYNWAKVKPVINQVNLESCCVMPNDLVQYAKAVSVQLLTHNDCSTFINQERLQETIESVATERDSDGWTPQWAVRYSGIIKCRGIIKMKGYVFHALRDNNKRIS